MEKKFEHIGAVRINCPEKGFSALATVYVGDDLVGEPYACLGVDLTAPGPAPALEGLRLDINFLDPVSGSLELFEASLGSLKPLIIGVV